MRGALIVCSGTKPMTKHCLFRETPCPACGGDHRAEMAAEDERERAWLEAAFDEAELTENCHSRTGGLEAKILNDSAYLEGV